MNYKNVWLSALSTCLLSTALSSQASVSDAGVGGLVGVSAVTAGEEAESTQFIGLRDKIKDILLEIRGNMLNGEYIIITGSDVSEDKFNVGTVAGIDKSEVLYDYFSTMTPFAKYPSGPAIMLHLTNDDANAEAANARCLLTAVEAADSTNVDINNVMNNLACTCALDVALEDQVAAGDASVHEAAQSSDMITYALSEELTGDTVNPDNPYCVLVNKGRTNLHYLNSAYVGLDKPLHAVDGSAWFQIGWVPFDAHALENQGL